MSSDPSIQLLQHLCTRSSLSWNPAFLGGLRDSCKNRWRGTRARMGRDVAVGVPIPEPMFSIPLKPSRFMNAGCVAVQKRKEVLASARIFLSITIIGSAYSLGSELHRR